MAGFLVVFLGVLILVVGVIMLVASRGKAFRQLVADGVDTTGVVVDKPLFGRVNSSRKGHHIRYSYKDHLGNEHIYRVVVTQGVFDAHAVGGPIEVVYSRSKPDVSSLKSLVDVARGATGKR